MRRPAPPPPRCPFQPQAVLLNGCALNRPARLPQASSLQAAAQRASGMARMRGGCLPASVRPHSLESGHLHSSSPESSLVQLLPPRPGTTTPPPRGRAHLPHCMASATSARPPPACASQDAPVPRLVRNPAGAAPARPSEPLVTVPAALSRDAACAPPGRLLPPPAALQTMLRACRPAPQAWGACNPLITLPSHAPPLQAANPPAPSPKHEGKPRCPSRGREHAAGMTRKAATCAAASRHPPPSPPCRPSPLSLRLTGLGFTTLLGQAACPRVGRKACVWTATKVL